MVNKVQERIKFFEKTAEAAKVESPSTTPVTTDPIAKPPVAPQKVEKTPEIRTVVEQSSQELQVKGKVEDRTPVKTRIPKADTNRNAFGFRLNQMKAKAKAKAEVQAPKAKKQVSLGAQDPGLAPTKSLDQNKLLRTSDPTAQPIGDEYLQWFLNQATLMQAIDQLDATDIETQKRLALIMLHGYSKAATVGEASASELGIQASPLLHEAHRYHRSSAKNSLLNTVTDAFAKDMGIQNFELHLVDNPKFSESIARQYPVTGIDTNVTSKASFEASLDQIFAKMGRGEPLGDRIVFDFSALLKADPKAPKDVRTTLIKDLEQSFVTKLTAHLGAHPELDPKATIDQLQSKLASVAFTTHKGQNVMLHPPFLTAASPNTKAMKEVDPAPTGLQKTVLDRLTDLTGKGATKHNELAGEGGEIDKLMIHTGYRPDPIQTKAAWLEVASPREIMTKLGLPVAELATKGDTIPKVAANFGAFASQPVVTKLGALADAPGAPPYVTTLAKSTTQLIDGLKTANVDKAFADKGLTDTLQLSYFRMMNAMNEAVLRKDDQIGFLNQIELVHQEISTILAVAEPYPKTAFADAIKTSMTEGAKPIVPKGLPDPKVHLKPSAMHCVSSIMGGVEAQKGSNQVNACILKDNYYESAFALEDHSKSYTTSVLDGDALRDARTGAPKPLDASQFGGKTPLDLFICDFHHNISIDRQAYRPENLKHQVDEMYAKGLVADKFTVAIDCTVDLVKSKDIQDFLQHNKKRIADGDLNVVFYRSAQKFDMLGMDNYYGGYSVSVNDGKSYKGFDKRMNAAEDQLGGLSSQGLAHLNTHAGGSLDQYREGLISNTLALYHSLPAGAIYREGTTNPMQISRIEDDKAVFLDLKFPNHPATGDAVKDALEKFAAAEKLPFTTRPSFGFPTTNFTLIQGGLQTRLNPGLDSPETLQRYSAFFGAVQKTIEDTVKKNKKLAQPALDTKIAEALAKMNVPPPPRVGH